MKLLILITIAFYYILCRNDVNGTPMTTVCIEIKPSDPFIEPYFMCKGSEYPQIHELAYGTGPYSNHNNQYQSEKDINLPVNYHQNPTITASITHKSSPTNNYQIPSNNKFQTEINYQQPSSSYYNEELNKKPYLTSSYDGGHRTHYTPEVYSNKMPSKMSPLTFDRLDRPQQVGLGSVQKDSSLTYSDRNTQHAGKPTGSLSPGYGNHHNLNNHESLDSNQYTKLINEHGNSYPTYPNSNYYQSATQEGHKNIPSHPSSYPNKNSYLIPNNLHYGNIESDPLYSMSSHDYTDYNSPVESKGNAFAGHYKEDIKNTPNTAHKGDLKLYDSPKSSAHTKYSVYQEKITPVTERGYDQKSLKTTPSNKDHIDYQKNNQYKDKEPQSTLSPQKADLYKSIPLYNEMFTKLNDQNKANEFQPLYNNQPHNPRSMDFGSMEESISEPEFHEDIDLRNSEYFNGPQRLNIPFTNEPLLGTQQIPQYTPQHPSVSGPTASQLYYPTFTTHSQLSTITTGAAAPGPASLPFIPCPTNYLYSMQPYIIPVPCYSPTPIYNIHSTVGASYPTLSKTADERISENRELINKNSDLNKDNISQNNNNNNNNDDNDKQRSFEIPLKDKSNKQSTKPMDDGVPATVTESSINSTQTANVSGSTEEHHYNNDNETINYNNLPTVTKSIDKNESNVNKLI